ncbi:MAG: Bcr/CflA family multidrug efflux MFS transporter [Reyranellaceae bacterium]
MPRDTDLPLSPPPVADRRLTPVLIAVLAMLTAFTPMSIDMYLPAFPTIRGDFQASTAEIQLSLSAFMLAFGFGQIFYGPLGDHFGRKPVLITGVVLYIASSALCALADNAQHLIALRAIQGLSACAAPVMARTMVRDLAERDRAAQVMSVLMASVSMAPMLAPLIGSTVMDLFGWRAIFLTLALFGTIALIAASFILKETLRPELRGPLAFGGIIRRFGELLTARTFMGYALTTGFLFGAMFSFISTSSFVLIGVYKLSPMTYSLVFGASVVAMTIGATVNSRMTRRVGADVMLRRACWLPAVAGVLLIAYGVIESQTGALGWIPIPLLSMSLITSMSFIAPNSTACALQRYPHMAGAAASLLGVVQFGCGSIFGALVGLLMSGSVLPMTLFMGMGGLLCFAAHRLLVRE